jgi:hypothetical protein
VAEFFKIPPNPLEVVFVVKKTIRPGEQLLISYEGDGPSYWSALGIKPAPLTATTYKKSDCTPRKSRLRRACRSSR